MLRLIISGFVSFILVVLIMPKYINLLKKIDYNQRVSEYSLDEFKNKAKTPTMGGVLFVLVTVLITLILNFQLLNYSILMFLLVFIGYALIGFLDDYIIIVKNNNEGLLPQYKLLLQVLIAIIFFILFQNHANTTVSIFNFNLDLKYFYGLFGLIMFTGEANAVNFTDGMDGLATGVFIIAIIPYLVYAYHIKAYGIAVLIASLIGALIGYLKFNRHPARVFMGDAGSLALGAGIAVIAMLLKVELSILIIGGVFLWEMLCVIIQQIAVRVFHKRVFLYTPIHYAFVKKGYPEQKVVTGFYWLQIGCSILGMIILWS